MIINLTTENFEKEVLQSDIPVLVDFWAPWCGFCVKMGPTLEDIASELDGKVKVAKINTDEQPDLAVKYGVMTLPTFMAFKNGAPGDKVIGAMGKDALLSRLGLK